jgi:23S rRNA (adenine2030-N6)-methyltransferase
LHPTDAKTLRANIAQLDAGRSIAVLQEDSFEGLKKFLPPPSRRALVLCDPSYEIKTDYARVVALMTDAVKRFPTGTYMVWYPIIPRPEAHDLPRKLKTLAVREGRAWLDATLTVKSSKLTTDDSGEVVRPGLPASGVFVINPPHTLKASLTAALSQIAKVLAQDKNKAFEVNSGG